MWIVCKGAQVTEICPSRCVRRFISVRDLQEALVELMKKQPFLSDASFLQWNELSRQRWERS